MSIEIRFATSPDELAEIGRLRYEVYVRELGRRPAGSDKMLRNLSRSLCLRLYAHNAD